MKRNIFFFIILNIYSCEMNKNISNNKTKDNLNIKENVSILNQIRRNPGLYIQGNDEQNAKVFIKSGFQEKFLKIKNNISVPVYNEFKVHGNNKDEKFSEIKVFASIFRKRF